MKLLHLTDIPIEGVSHNPEIKKQVFIKNGEVPKLTNFSTSVFKPGQSCEEHSHETMFEIYFVLSGSATLTINHSPFTINQNDCITIEPKEVHSMANNGSEDLVLLYFGIATD